VQTGGWYDQTISKLCFSCHDSVGGGVGAHDVTQTAFSSANHYNEEGSIPPDPSDPTTAGQDNATMIGSGLPYVTTGTLACTSCHNVHNDQYRPFVHRSDIQTVCEACHTNLRRATTAQNTVDGVSVHPLGIGVDNAATTALGNIKATIDADLATGIRADNTWRLGGKRAVIGSGSSTGNMECQTCHSVHGVQNAADTGTKLTGSEDVLTLYNKSSNSTSTSIFLCNPYHYGGVAGQQVGVSGTDHPMDGNQGRTAFYPTGVGLPASWTDNTIITTKAAAMYDNSSVLGPRCSSCHDTHGGIAATSLLRPIAGTTGDGQTGNTAWCFSCHSDTIVVPSLHHSNITTAGANSLIDCDGCHGGASAQQEWSAHNGFGDFAVGPDTNSSTPAAGTGDFFTTASNSGTFQFLCESCHEPLNPTTFDNTSWNINRTTFPAHGNFSASETASHKVSVFDNATQLLVQDTAAANEPWNTFFRVGSTGTDNSIWGTVSTNAAASYSGADIRSKFANYGTGTPTDPQTPEGGAYLICESCHNLLYNAGTPTGVTDLTAGYEANLLLFQYEDDVKGIAQAGSAVGDGLCRGCHASSQMADTDLGNPPASLAYVHYPPAHTSGPNYTYDLNPYGRGTGTILTSPYQPPTSCPNVSTADGLLTPNTTPGTPYSYPAAQAVNCDSCHRPHNADTDSTKYILEPGAMTSGQFPKSDPCKQCHDVSVQCAQ
jgi:predicted CXXCH cytochrome family protein